MVNRPARRGSCPKPEMPDQSGGRATDSLGDARAALGVAGRDILIAPLDGKC